MTRRSGPDAQGEQRGAQFGRAARRVEQIAFLDPGDPRWAAQFEVRSKQRGQVRRAVGIPGGGEPRLDRRGIARVAGDAEQQDVERLPGRETGIVDVRPDRPRIEPRPAARNAAYGALAHSAYAISGEQRLRGSRGSAAQRRAGAATRPRRTPAGAVREIAQRGAMARADPSEADPGRPRFVAPAATPCRSAADRATTRSGAPGDAPLTTFTTR